MIRTLPQSNSNIDSTLREDDFDEIDLTSEEGIDAFANNAKDLYEEIGRIADKLVDDAEFANQLKEISIKFDKVIEQANKEFRSIGDIGDSVVDEMQGLYDQLVGLRERLIVLFKQSKAENNRSVTEDEIEKLMISDSWSTHERGGKGVLHIDQEEDEESIPLEIRVGQATEENIDESLPVDDQAYYHHQLVKETDPIHGVAGTMESDDPINQAVAREKTPINVEEFYSRIPLINEYLQSEVVKNFVAEKYGSSYQFERDYLNSVTVFEKQSEDRLDKILGVKYASPFDYYHDTKLSELIDIFNQPNLRQTIISKGMKYETFLLWEDFISELQTVADDDTSLGEAYLQWFIISRSKS